MKPLSFIVVGSGWRAIFFAKIARRCPQLFEMKYMLCRTAEKAALIRETEGIPTTTSAQECEQAEPDFVVIAVNKASICDVAKEWIAKGFPVLLETPAADSVERLKELWDLKVNHGAKIQVAEQYIRYPILASGLRAVNEGKLGDPYAVYLSAAHDYHAASLIRHMLKLGFEPMKIRGKSYSFPVTETDSRYGLIHDGSVKERERNNITIEFASGKVAFYDFSGVQYRTQIRARHINVQGQNGEWNDMFVRWVDGEWNAHAERLSLYLDPAYADLDTGDLKNRRNCQNPALIMDHAQDEYAVGSMMMDMRAFIEEGKEAYPLSEALEDAYTWLLMERALEQPGMVVESERMPWQDGV